MKKKYLLITLLVLGMGLFAQTVTKVTKTISPFVNTFPVVMQDNVSGGYHQVTDVAGRDALPAGLKQTGMLVWVQATHAAYQWDGAAWRQVQLVRNWEEGASFYIGDVFLYQNKMVFAKTAGTIAVAANPLTDMTNWNSIVGIADATAADNTLRWNGTTSKWEESTALKNDATNITISGDLSVAGADLTLGVAATAAAGSIVFNDGSTATNTVTLKAPATITADYILSLPAAAGTAGQMLKTDGAGNLSWGTGGLANGTAADNTLRWNNSTTVWEESPALKNNGTNVTTSGDINLNGGDLVTTATTASLFNSAATTLNIGGAASTVNIGALLGTATINNNSLLLTQGALKLGNSAVGYASVGSIQFSDVNSTTPYAVTLRAPNTLTSSYTLFLPAAVGTANQILQTDASGNLSWANALTNALPSANILVGNASNVATAVTMSGDATISNAGALSIGTGKVTSTHILDGTIATADVADAAVTYAKIQNVSATDKVLGRTTAGAGVVEEISTTGSGNVVRATSPTLVTPNLGIPSTLVGTNITGTASGLTAGNVTTNANLTGEVTSVGNATTVTNAAVIGKLLTGYTSGAGTVAATDNILQAIQKLNGNIAAAAPDATTLATGKVQLAGDLSGTAAAPTVAASAITSAKIADGTIAEVDLAANAVTSAKILDATIADADVSATAAIAGTKISPDFGTQAVTTTGNISGGNLTATSSNLTLGTAAVATSGKVVFNDATTGTFAATLAGPANATANYTLTLPNALGTANQVLQTDATGNLSWATPGATGWGTTGNAGTTAGTNFIGTTDNVDLIFKRNSLLAGKLGAFNTAFGTVALYSTTGSYNSGFGVAALQSNSTGTNNTAMGYQALFGNTTGSNSTAVGYNALYVNTASGITAVGSNALAANTTGMLNTAVGYNALATNTTGMLNTAVGYQALKVNTANSNTAVGGGVLAANTTGFSNTALGSNALSSNTQGNSNTAMGYTALFVNTTGTNNTAIGNNALDSHITGSYNTAIGNLADEAKTVGDNCTAIGNGASTAGNSNWVEIGNTSVLTIHGQVAYTNASDKRVKTNIRENVPGLGFIMKLKPISYNFNLEAQDRITGAKADTTPAGLASRKKAEAVVHTGFAAQDVEQALNELGYDFDGLNKPQNQQSLYSLGYATFTVPLVKAVQEQQATILEQQAQNEAQQKQIQLQQQQIDQLRTMVEALMKK